MLYLTKITIAKYIMGYYNFYIPNVIMGLNWGLLMVSNQELKKILQEKG